jgi:hypothetical protein
MPWGGGRGSWHLWMGGRWQGGRDMGRRVNTVQKMCPRVRKCENDTC